jgi:shikimate dehydrogenase
MLSPYDNYLYSSLEINDMNSIYKLLRRESTAGASITIPYKKDIIKHLDKKHISIAATQIGAVNTIYKKNDMLYGENTDWSGFLKSIRNQISLGNLKNKQALIIGSGGVSKAFIYALKSIGMKITILSRSKTNIKDIELRIKTMYYKELPFAQSQDNFSQNVI